MSRASKLEILCACDKNCTFAKELYVLREALQEIVNISSEYGPTLVGQGYVKCGEIAQKALTEASRRADYATPAAT